MFSLINFFGKWTVEVISKNSPFDIRFEIRGSGGLVGGGPFPGVEGKSVDVNGPDWHLSFEWSDPGKFLWHACEARKLNADFLPDKGLVVTVGAHRDVPAEVNHPYDGLVVRLRNTDAQLNPFVPIPATPDFTFKREKRPTTPTPKVATH